MTDVYLRHCHYELAELVCDLAVLAYSGRYFCRILPDRVPMTKPIVVGVDIPVPFIARHGNPLVVSVQAFGDPDPEVTWYVGKRRVVGTENYSFSRDGPLHSLSVGTVDNELNKGIIVRARNTNGEDRFHLAVSVYRVYLGFPSEQVYAHATENSPNTRYKKRRKKLQLPGGYASLSSLDSSVSSNEARAPDYQLTIHDKFNKNNEESVSYHKSKSLPSSPDSDAIRRDPYWAGQSGRDFTCRSTASSEDIFKEIEAIPPLVLPSLSKVKNNTRYRSKDETVEKTMPENRANVSGKPASEDKKEHTDATKFKGKEQTDHACKCMKGDKRCTCAYKIIERRKHSQDKHASTPAKGSSVSESFTKERHSKEVKDTDESDRAKAKEDWSPRSETDKTKNVSPASMVDSVAPHCGTDFRKQPAVSPTSVRLEQYDNGIPKSSTYKKEKTVPISLTTVRRAENVSPTTVDKTSVVPIRTSTTTVPTDQSTVTSSNSSTNTKGKVGPFGTTHLAGCVPPTTVDKTSAVPSGTSTTTLPTEQSSITTPKSSTSMKEKADPLGTSRLAKNVSPTMMDKTTVIPSRPESSRGESRALNTEHTGDTSHVTTDPNEQEEKKCVKKGVSTVIDDCKNEALWLPDKVDSSTMIHKSVCLRINDSVSVKETQQHAPCLASEVSKETISDHGFLDQDALLQWKDDFSSGGTSSQKVYTPLQPVMMDETNVASTNFSGAKHPYAPRPESATRVKEFKMRPNMNEAVSLKVPFEVYGMSKEDKNKVSHEIETGESKNAYDKSDWRQEYLKRLASTGHKSESTVSLPLKFEDKINDDLGDQCSPKESCPKHRRRKEVKSDGDVTNDSPTLKKKKSRHSRKHRSKIMKYCADIHLNPADGSVTSSIKDSTSTVCELHCPPNSFLKTGDCVTTSAVARVHTNHQKGKLGTERKMITHLHMSKEFATTVKYNTFVTHAYIQGVNLKKTLANTQVDKKPVLNTAEPGREIGRSSAGKEGMSTTRESLVPNNNYKPSSMPVREVAILHGTLWNRLVNSAVSLLVLITAILLVHLLNPWVEQAYQI